MKKLFCAVSIVALQLIVSPSGLLLEQNSVAVAQLASISPEIDAMLADTRPISKLSNGQLRRRLRIATGAAFNDKIPQAGRDRLSQIARDARSEIKRRADKGSDAAEREEGDEPPPKKKEKKKAVAEVEEEPAPEKRPRVKIEAEFDNEPPPEEKPRVETESDEEPAPEARPRKKVIVVEDEEPAPEERPVAGSSRRIPREVEALLADDRDREEMDAAELSERVRLAFRYSRSDGLSAEVREQLVTLSNRDRQELLRRESGRRVQRDDDQQEIVVERERPREIIVGEDREGNPAAEREARALLNDGRNVKALESGQLRRRLDTMRELLATNALDPRTARELRRRVLTDREVLRERIAFEQAEEDQVAGRTKSSPQIVVGGRTGDAEIRIILGDRRRSEDLSREELDRRIKVYRDIENDSAYTRYDEFERRRWRETLVTDRVILRRRLLREREERAGELTLELNRGKLDIELGIQVPVRPRRDVFVAEADDEEIEEILVAPPSVKPRRRYTVEEIADAPEVRKTLPRIEIDTVRFGFNEAFVREEEIGSLDRIAAVMERILKKYPREVFLIEGHTDAVGSDVYNMSLSRQRAEAIKRALTTYYVLPPESLRTVGLGERYLKIPTPEAEAENRRVSISRVTQYLSSAQ